MMKGNPLKQLSKLLPLLALYALLILLFSPKDLQGDENRYIRYATHLTEGFFLSSDNPDLRNGPGYPLVLAPFVAMGANPIVPKLLNALFVFIGIVFMYRALQFYTNKKTAIIGAYILGLYPPLLRWMLGLYSEALSFMLICGIIYYTCKLYRQEGMDWKAVGLASLSLGFLILTKVIFFHVMVVSAIVLGLLFLLVKERRGRKAIWILIGGFVFIIPYLIYAQSMTGKWFYLSTGGGEILYHRSTPYENEWGNWIAADHILYDHGQLDEHPGTHKNELMALSTNHGTIYKEFESMTHMERDSAFKAVAIENMKKYPTKYMKNTFSNVGRFLFNYPISYRYQNMNAYGYLIPNMFIVVLFLLVLFPAFLARRTIPFEIKGALIFAFIYGGGMILMGGKARYFVMMVPGIFLSLSYIFTNILALNWKKPPLKT